MFRQHPVALPQSADLHPQIGRDLLRADWLRRSAPAITAMGLALLLVGLAWDAVLHRLDPTLAEREGVFSLSNPGHVLFGAGIVIVALGTVIYLAASAVDARRKMLLLAAAAGLAVLASGSIALAVGTGSLGNLAHQHDHGAAAVDSGNNPANSSLPGVTHDHGEAVAISAEQLQAAQKLVDDTRVGTQRFQDINVALQEGYFLLAGARDGLAHYHNQAYDTDGKILDPQHPEELIYLRSRNGDARLVGVMYLMPSTAEPGPRVGGPLTAWHSHDNLCLNPVFKRITGFTDANGKCPAGSVWMGKTPEMLHVWLAENPNGVFSDNMQPAALVQLLNSQPGR